MTFLLYIGKNKDFLRKFSKLENVQMIYAQNYQDAITICIRLKVRENIIVLHEQGEMNGDIEQIGAFRKKFYQAYVVLITDRLTPEASKVYLNSGINDTVSLNITTARLRQKIDIINKRQELLYAHNWKKKDDLTVTVNGTNYQIKRGVEVMVPRSVALAIERSNKQEIEAEKYIESLKEA